MKLEVSKKLCPEKRAAIAAGLAATCLSAGAFGDSCRLRECINIDGCAADAAATAAALAAAAIATATTGVTAASWWLIDRNGEAVRWRGGPGEGVRTGDFERWDAEDRTCGGSFSKERPRTNPRRRCSSARFSNERPCTKLRRRCNGDTDRLAAKAFAAALTALTGGAVIGNSRELFERSSSDNARELLDRGGEEARAVPPALEQKST